MLKCPNCGEDNAFGRVFCAGCGTKLDLATINEGDIEEMGKTGRWMSYWPFYVGGVVVLILALVALAFWPPSEKLGEQGKRSEGSLVKNQIAMIKRIGKGQVIGPAFTEKQLNSYMAYYSAKKLGLSVMSVDIEGEIIRARVGRKFGPFGPSGKQFHFSLVADVDYAAEGAKLVPQGGSLGHLPLPGPLAGISHSIIAGAVKDAQEWKSLKYVKEISIEKGRVRLKASK